MITRRKFLIVVAGALTGPIRAVAQQPPSRSPRIGFLSAAANVTPFVDELRAGLRDLGYIEGKNIILDFRWADGNYSRLPSLAEELVHIPVDVIVAHAPPAIQAAQHATNSIPIVMTATADPISAKFVKSLSRPGGNITGLSNISSEASAKYVEFLRIAIPGLSRIAVLSHSGHPNHPEFLRSVQTSAKAANIAVIPLDVTNANELRTALSSASRGRAGAMIVLPDSLFNTQQLRIIEFAMNNRLPAMFWSREFTEAGALLSYGQNTVEHFRRAAAYIDKILKGAKPADLPVEQATKLELVINRKTAAAIGLNIPKELLLRADKVIE